MQEVYLQQQTNFEVECLAKHGGVECLAMQGGVVLRVTIGSSKDSDDKFHQFDGEDEKARRL